MNTTLKTRRLFSATPSKIFAAFQDGNSLAQWWGPKDFRNTFRTFEFKSGGQWVYTMHAPNGVDYPNESVFREVVPNSKVVIEHTAQPWFQLTITLTPQGDKTLLTWSQQFENEDMANRLRPMCEPANEQNLDKLEAILK